jgi:hypothetical protein
LIHEENRFRENSKISVDESFDNEDFMMEPNKTVYFIDNIKYPEKDLLPRTPKTLTHPLAGIKVSEIMEKFNMANV